MQAPSTVMQVALLILLVLPGATYQFLRERWRGPVAGERVLGERLLRAVVASIVLDAAYLLAAGPHLVRLARGAGPGDWTGLLERPRLVGAVTALLFLVVPAAMAASVSWWESRRRRASYRPVPTAWDHAFHDRESCFVRVRLTDGNWAGGWYGASSYASSFPHPAELFLESAWTVDRDGRFGTRVDGTGGLLLRADDFDVLEFLVPPVAGADPRKADNGGTDPGSGAVARGAGPARQRAQPGILAEEPAEGA
ncbi:DUF6338 family protein [Micromonospora sp. WMMD882]|uniref:DUF6338 family protein n=1 Tax=Micromonospora sp. WMMD882 TaxID=3015151 RepID=UPI00248C282B|nr:DUF6338 family protein [Micromonospora sp. WMMD882]WBB79549.1 DUF6338 family protein [Micromonospora sp. WMMD882]